MTPSAFKSVFSQHANTNNAVAMSAYMKNRFAFYGIKTPERRRLFRQIVSENPTPEDMQSLWKLCTALYGLPQRELHYAALELLIQYKKYWGAEDLSFFEWLITTNSWWDSVDVIAPKILGPFFITYPDQIRPAVKRWLQSENIWLQRSALLFQLKYKSETDTELMEHAILSLKDSKEFFVRKAIGWLLREYARTNAHYVLNFTSKHELSPLSKREALKHL